MELHDFPSSVKYGTCSTYFWTEPCDWQVHAIYFARHGFTPEASKYLKTQSVLALDLKRVDAEIE
jgi:hypothetical protein